VGEILSIAERLKAMNRALIKKLRPGPLGRVKLAELIKELTAGLQGRHPDTQIHTDIGELAKSYGEQVDLTLYRCIQEAITNAIRHGQAANITVTLAEGAQGTANGSKRSGKDVRLTITDDGKGIAPSTPKGFGLTTMTERMRSLGGTCDVESAPYEGTTIRVGIPRAERKQRARTSARIGWGAIMTRVLVIDDHPIVLQGCRQLLEDVGVDQIQQAQSLADGFRLCRTQKPDVIIVDLAMRTGSLGGLSFIRRLRLHDQQTPILVFTMHSDPVIVSRALEVGATGYVLKDTPPEEVQKAFQRVRDNRPYLSHDLASEVAFMEARGTTNPLRRMTVRELQTLALVAEGKPYGVIAEHLHVSYKTVANTCTQLKAKLGVRTLPELMRIAIQHLPSTNGRT
jgi:two-component system invasion response regulator UvrY